MRTSTAIRTLTRSLALILLALPVALWTSGCGEETTGPDDDVSSLTPRIVIPQSLMPVDGVLTVDSAVSDGPGWLVIHRDNGSNGPVTPEIIGRIKLDSGVSADLRLMLDSVVADGEKIWLMLHEDDGTIGRYEFEGPDSPDQPVTLGTAIVMVSTTIDQTDPAISVDDQTMENNSISVSDVSSPGSAWLVFHKTEQGDAGDVITSIPVDAGSAGKSVRFPTGPSTSLRAGDTVIAMLHVDRGTGGTYEFPGPDVPMRDREGNVVQKRFIILPPAIQSVIAEDQPIDAGKLFVLEVNSDNPGWIVLHEDDGSGRPRADRGVAWARVWSGKTTDVALAIEEPITPNVRIWAVLHADDSPVGSYDFPTSDLPVEGGGEFIGDSFEIVE